MKTSKQLVEYVKRKAAEPKTIYVLGSFGQILTQEFLNQKCRQLAWNEQNRHILQQYADKGYQAFDCCGLIKAFLWDDNPSNYKVAEDENEATMLARAKVKGKIGTMPERAGILVFMPGHVGVYIGGGEVVECTPSEALGGWGVLTTKLKGRGWTDWAEYARISYDKPAGWQQADGCWFYFLNGVMLKGWRWLPVSNGSDAWGWFYFNPANGIMQANKWVKFTDGKLYELGKNGKWTGNHK